MRILLALFLLYSPFAKAQNAGSKAKPESTFQEEVQERAKRRQYAGGRDEGDLKVQAQLVTPTRKFAPVVEEPAEPDSHD